MNKLTHKITLLQNGRQVASYQTADLDRARKEAKKWTAEGAGRIYVDEPLPPTTEETEQLQRESIPTGEYLTQGRR